MEGEQSAERVLDTVAQRRDVIGAIAAGEGHVRDLRDSLDLSRSTVYEATRELESVGLVTRNDGFELTPFGRSAVGTYDEYLGALETLCDLQHDLTGLPDGETLDPVICREADVVRAEPHAPDRPFEALAGAFEGTTRMKGFLPVTGARYIEGLETGLDEESFSLDVLTEPRVVEYLLSNHPEAVREWIDSDRIRLYETESRLPFGLLIEEEPTPTVGVLLYDEAGGLRVLLRAGGRTAVAWGRERFRAYRESATELAGDVGAD